MLQRHIESMTGRVLSDVVHGKKDRRKSSKVAISFWPMKAELELLTQTSFKE